jgi:phage gpG-like protein
MSELRLELKGLREEQARMTKIVADLHGEPMLEGMRNATLLVTRDAKRFAPVDTGRLRASIIPEIRVSGPTQIQGVVGSNVEYAPFVELGTKPHWPPVGALEVWARRHGISAFLVARAISRRGTKAVKYLERAFDQNISRIVGYIDAAVKSIIRSNS